MSGVKQKTCNVCGKTYFLTHECTSETQQVNVVQIMNELEDHAAIDRYRSSLRKRVEDAIPAIENEIAVFQHYNGQSLGVRKGRLNTLKWFLSILDEQTEKI